jgi:hypothetical protein
MKDDKKKHSDERSKNEAKEAAVQRKASRSSAEPGNESPNPPRTTTGGMTSPKFGSAGSGGAELEPGPEKD